jgi:predicted lipoprotein with Yx(FWY)xxD motif
MLDAGKQQTERSRRRRRLPTRTAGAAGATLAAVALPAAIALATSGTLTINSAANAKLGERVVVNAQGRTLYALSPETTSHLLCKSSQCLAFWPPVTVPSRTTKLKAGSGVQGRLGILRRSGGVLQVTLRGLPLYRFAADHAKGQVNGQGMESFGGTWHVVTASSGSAKSSPPPASPPPSPAPSPPPGYGYGY